MTSRTGVGAEDLETFVESARRAARLQRQVGIGPIPVDVAAATPGELDHVAQHVRASTTLSWPALRVTLVDATTIDPTTIPDALRPVGDETIVHHQHDAIAVANGFEGTLWILDRATGHAVRWLSNAHELPYGEHVSPLSLALRWWASVSARGALVHAGAVATEHGAVLLGGQSGAGKSTSTMACADRGLDVLGDDQVLVELGPHGPIAHPVYRLAKLTPDSIDLLPHLHHRVVAEGRYGKSLIDLSLSDIAPRPVRAICLVNQNPDQRTHLAPISRADVLKAVGVSTMFQLTIAKHHTWEIVSALVRASDCHELVVNRPDDVPGVVTGLLDAGILDAGVLDRSRTE